MDLIALQVDKWGISLETYFGDIYMPWRTLIIAVVVTLVVRVLNKRKARRGY